MDARSSSFDEHAVVQAHPDVYACTLGSGAALLDLRTSTYYSLNAVGSEIWTLLAEPVAVDDLHQRLLDKFEIDSERCRRDLLALLENFPTAGLIRVQHASPA